MTTIFNPASECMDRTALRSLQGQRLADLAKRAYDNVPLYKKRFDELGVKPEDIKTIDDIVKLPFTTKADFRDEYPFGLFAVPKSKVVRLHASSGTTGKPTVVGYTRQDIETWSEGVARTLGCGGGTEHDVLQNAYGYGLFTGGLGLHYGCEKLGATVIPMSGGNTKKQLMLMQDFGTTLICCTPSYALQLAEVAQEEGVDIKNLPIKAGFFGAEPWTEEMRVQIEAKLNLKAIDIYGMSELMGPGVSSECLVQQGLHVFEDHYYPEIINPETGEQVAAGEKGELVVTCITKECIPLIRYRTRDITHLIEEPCACGRTSRRMARISGRTDDMLIIRGVNVFPSQIESVLMQVEGIEPHYEIHVEREGTLDQLEIKVEVSQEIFSDEIRKLEGLQARIKGEIRSTLGLGAKITLVEPKSIERSLGKAKRVFDRRTSNG